MSVVEASPKEAYDLSASSKSGSSYLTGKRNPMPSSRRDLTSILLPFQYPLYELGLAICISFSVVSEFFGELFLERGILL